MLLTNRPRKRRRQPVGGAEGALFSLKATPGGRGCGSQLQVRNRLCSSLRANQDPNPAGFTEEPLGSVRARPGEGGDRTQAWGHPGCPQVPPEPLLPGSSALPGRLTCSSNGLPSVQPAGAPAEVRWVPLISPLRRCRPGC